MLPYWILTDIWCIDSPIDRFTERHTYLDLDDIAYRDLGREEERTSSRSNKERDISSPTPTPPANVPGMAPGTMQQGMPVPQPPPGHTGGFPPNVPNPLASGVAPPGAGPLNPYQQRAPRDFSPHRAGPPSLDGNDDKRRGGRGPPVPPLPLNKRRRSPSPPGRRGNFGPDRRRPVSPARVGPGRATPTDDFPEAIPWLMAQLPSKTVFAGEEQPPCWHTPAGADISIILVSARTNSRLATPFAPPHDD